MTTYPVGTMFPSPSTLPPSAADSDPMFGINPYAGSGTNMYLGNAFQQNTQRILQARAQQQQELAQAAQFEAVNAAAGGVMETDPRTWTPQEAQDQTDRALAKLSTVNPELAAELAAKRTGVQPEDNGGFFDSVKEAVGTVLHPGLEIFGRAMEFIGRTSHIVPNIAFDIADGGAFELGDDVGGALTGTVNHNWNSVMQEMGWEGGGVLGVIRAGIGLIGDVATDPLTWLIPMGGVPGKLADAGIQAGKEVAGKGLGTLAGKSVEELTTMGFADFSKELAGKSADDIAKLWTDHFNTVTTNLGDEAFRAGLEAPDLAERAAAAIDGVMSAGEHEFFKRGWEIQSRMYNLIQTKGLKYAIKNDLVLSDGLKITGKDAWKMLENKVGAAKGANPLTAVGKQAWKEAETYAGIVGGMRLKVRVPYTTMRYIGSPLFRMNRWASHSPLQVFTRFFAGQSATTSILHAINEGADWSLLRDYMEKGWFGNIKKNVQGIALDPATRATVENMRGRGANLGSMLYSASERAGGLTLHFDKGARLARTGLPGALGYRAAIKADNAKRQFVKFLMARTVGEDADLGRFAEERLGLSLDPKKLTASVEDQWDMAKYLDYFPPGADTSSPQAVESLFREIYPQYDQLVAEGASDELTKLQSRLADMHQVAKKFDKSQKESLGLLSARWEAARGQATIYESSIGDTRFNWEDAFGIHTSQAAEWRAQTGGRQHLLTRLGEKQDGTFYMSAEDAERFLQAKNRKGITEDMLSDGGGMKFRGIRVSSHRKSPHDIAVIIRGQDFVELDETGNAAMASGVVGAGPTTNVLDERVKYHDFLEETFNEKLLQDHPHGRLGADEIAKRENTMVTEALKAARPNARGVFQRNADGSIEATIFDHLDVKAIGDEFQIAGAKRGYYRRTLNKDFVEWTRGLVPADEAQILLKVNGLKSQIERRTREYTLAEAEAKVKEMVKEMFPDADLSTLPDRLLEANPLAADLDYINTLAYDIGAQVLGDTAMRLDRVGRLAPFMFGAHPRSQEFEWQLSKGMMYALNKTKQGVKTKVFTMKAAEKRALDKWQRNIHRQLEKFGEQSLLVDEARIGEHDLPDPLIDTMLRYGDNLEQATKLVGEQQAVIDRRVSTLADEEELYLKAREQAMEAFNAGPEKGKVNLIADDAQLRAWDDFDQAVEEGRVYYNKQTGKIYTRKGNLVNKGGGVQITSPQARQLELEELARDQHELTRAQAAIEGRTHFDYDEAMWPVFPAEEEFPPLNPLREFPIAGASDDYERIAELDAVRLEAEQREYIIKNGANVTPEYVAKTAELRKKANELEQELRGVTQDQMDKEAELQKLMRDREQAMDRMNQDLTDEQDDAVVERIEKLDEAIVAKRAELDGLEQEQLFDGSGDAPNPEDFTMNRTPEEEAADTEAIAKKLNVDPARVEEAKAGPQRGGGTVVWEGEELPPGTEVLIRMQGEKRGRRAIIKGEDFTEFHAGPGGQQRAATGNTPKIQYTNKAGTVLDSVDYDFVDKLTVVKKAEAAAEVAPEIHPGLVAEAEKQGRTPLQVYRGNEARLKAIDDSIAMREKHLAESQAKLKQAERTDLPESVGNADKTPAQKKAAHKAEVARMKKQVADDQAQLDKVVQEKATITEQNAGGPPDAISQDIAARAKADELQAAAEKRRAAKAEAQRRNQPEVIEAEIMAETKGTGLAYRKARVRAHELDLEAKAAGANYDRYLESTRGADTVTGAMGEKMVKLQKAAMAAEKKADAADAQAAKLWDKYVVEREGKAAPEVPAFQQSNADAALPPPEQVADIPPEAIDRNYLDEIDNAPEGTYTKGSIEYRYKNSTDPKEREHLAKVLADVERKDKARKKAEFLRKRNTPEPARGALPVKRSRLEEEGIKEGTGHQSLGLGKTANQLRIEKAEANVARLREMEQKWKKKAQKYLDDVESGDPKKEYLAAKVFESLDKVSKEAQEAEEGLSKLRVEVFKEEQEYQARRAGTAPGGNENVPAAPPQLVPIPEEELRNVERGAKLTTVAKKKNIELITARIKTNTEKMNKAAQILEETEAKIAKSAGGEGEKLLTLRAKKALDLYIRNHQAVENDKVFLALAKGKVRGKEGQAAGFVPASFTKRPGTARKYHYVEEGYDEVYRRRKVGTNPDGTDKYESFLVTSEVNPDVLQEPVVPPGQTYRMKLDPQPVDPAIMKELHEARSAASARGKHVENRDDPLQSVFTPGSGEERLQAATDAYVAATKDLLPHQIYRVEKIKKGVYGGQWGIVNINDPSDIFRTYPNEDVAWLALMAKEDAVREVRGLPPTEDTANRIAKSALKQEQDTAGGVLSKAQTKVEKLRQEQIDLQARIDIGENAGTSGGSRMVEHFRKRLDEVNDQMDRAEAELAVAKADLELKKAKKLDPTEARLAEDDPLREGAVKEAEERFPARVKFSQVDDEFVTHDINGQEHNLLDHIAESDAMGKDYQAVERARVDHAKESILKNGFWPDQPIVVILQADGQYKLAEGFHRMRATRELIKEGKLAPDVDIPVVYLTEEEAMQASRKFGKRYGNGPGNAVAGSVAIDAHIHGGLPVKYTHEVDYESWEVREARQELLRQQGAPGEGIFRPVPGGRRPGQHRSPVEQSLYQAGKAQSALGQAAKKMNKQRRDAYEAGKVMGRLKEQLNRSMNELNKAHAKAKGITAQLTPSLVKIDTVGDLKGLTLLRIPGMEGYAMPHYIAAEWHDMLDKHGPGHLSLEWRKWVLGPWKRWATFRWPGFHVRNFFGAWFNNYLGGVGLNEYGFAWRVNNWGKKDWANKLVSNDHFDGYMMKELFGEEARGKLTYGHVKEHLSHIGIGQANTRMVMESEGLMDGATTSIMLLGKAPSKAHQGLRKVDGFLRDTVGGGVEDYHRVAAWAQGMAATGGDTYGARSFVMMRHGDYAELTKAEDHIRDFIPFYKWMRTNIPYQIRTLAEHPTRITNISEKAKHTAYDVAGVDQQQAELNQMPFMKQTMALPIPDWVPFIGSKGPDAIKYAMFDLPYSDLYSGLNDYISGAVPIGRNILESYGAHKQFYTGKPLEGRMVKLSGLWNTPGIRDLLALTPYATKGEDGGIYIKDQVENILTAWPIYSRFRNFMEADEARVEQRMGGVLSMIAGLGVREADATAAELDFYYHEVEPILNQYRDMGVTFPSADDFIAAADGLTGGTSAFQPDSTGTYSGITADVTPGGGSSSITAKVV